MSESTVIRHRRGFPMTPWLGAVAATTVGVALTFSASGNAADRPLRYHADQRNFLIGSATGTTALATDSGWAGMLGQEFNYITPDGQLMWDSTEPFRDSFTFADGDALVRFAQRHNQKVRGHPLVWHTRLPGWVTSTPQSQLLDVMRSHITGVAGHYAGRMHAWDVVTEPLDDDGTLRDTVWLQGIGPGYIGEAFRAARAADPTAKLYLNDYGIEGLNPKSTGLYELVKALRQQGVPIDGVGFQAHLTVGRVPATLRENVERFAALGLDVAFTAMDVRLPLPATSSELNQQANDYREVLDVCLDVPRCVSYTVWGFGDRHSWVPAFYPGQGAACLFDERLRPKPAYRAVKAALRTGPAKPPTSNSEPNGTTTPAATAGNRSTPSGRAVIGTPASTASPTSSPQPPVLPPGSCRVGYAVVNQWPGGFQSDVRVTNAGPKPVTGWTLRWSYASGQTISQVWSGTYRQSGATVTVTNVDWNRVIGPNGAVSIGLLGTWSAANPRPTAFTLNGVACTTG